MLRNKACVGILVYGRNRFHWDSETGLRVSRLADAEDITYGDAPDLAIIADDMWNTVQDRLEGDEAGDTLLARLKVLETEVQDLRAEVARADKPAGMAVRTPTKLQAIYRTEVARLEALLTAATRW